MPQVMKMKDVTRDGFSSVLYALPERIAQVIEGLPLFIKNNAYEIRLRAGAPLCITAEHSFYVGCDALCSTKMPKNPLIVSSNEINEVLLRICDRSLYKRERELREGYLSMKGGNRAGVCGCYSFGKLLHATSINIRIARQIKGSADCLVPYASGGILIAGPPGSGKTTLLRDLVRQLSYSGKRVSVIDTRGEICGSQETENRLDVGPNTDVISGLPKAQGIEMALRTMFPDYIAFDEVGNGGEADLVEESFSSGSAILTTAHLDEDEDVFSRAVTAKIMSGGCKTVARLSSRIGELPRIYTGKEAKRFA